MEIRQAVKFAEGTDDTLEILAIPYGGPWKNAAGKPADLQGEYFSANTDLCLGWFEDRPLLYEHGLDETLQAATIGRFKVGRTDEAGTWAQAQLDKSAAYFDAITGLVKAGKLYGSSGSVPHLVRTDRKSGEILRWPLIELTLTPNPANLLATVAPVDAEKHYAAVGIKSAKLEELAAAKAYVQVDFEGSYEDLISDLAALLNPRSPFGEPLYDAWTSVIATFPDYVIACRYGSDGDSDYYRVSYTVGSDQEPQLTGEPLPVEPVFVPLPQAAISMAGDAADATRRFDALASSAKALAERRVKEGRVLSSSNRSALTKAQEACRAAADSLAALLDATDPEAKAKAATVEREDLELLQLWAAVTLSESETP